MKNLFTIIMLSFAVLTAGCSDDDEKKFGNITVPDKGQLNQSLKADQNSGSLTFETADTWIASLAENLNRADGDLSWIGLDKYSGAAGRNTVNFTLSDNNTGQDRSATITVISGGDRFTATVKQEKTRKDGTVPDGNSRTVSKVTIKKPDYTEVYNFTYDSQGRVNKLRFTYDEDYDEINADITYSGNTITMKYSEIWNDYFRSMSSSGKRGHAGTRNSSREAYTSETAVTAQLNNGRIVSGHAIEIDEDDDQYVYDWTVDYNGSYVWKVTKSEYELVDGEKEDEGTSTDECTWTDGNLTRVGDESFYTLLTYHSDVMNNSGVNLDLNYLISQDESYVLLDEFFLHVLGYYGSRSRNMIATTNQRYSSESHIVSYDYTQDEEGFITRVDITEGSSKTVVTVEYK